MRVIDLGHGYRLRRLDDLNWVLQRFRRPTERKDLKDRSERWFDAGRYYTTLGHALADVYEMTLRDMDGAVSLGEAMAEARALHDDIMAVGARLSAGMGEEAAS